jgi:hypothetical protein
MKRLYSLIAWLLIATQATAGITYSGTTGQTLYARVQTGASTFVGVAMTEGSSGGLGIYNVSDAALVSAGITTASGTTGYQYTIRSGSASNTANDAIVGVGTLHWAGSVEGLPKVTESAKAQTYYVDATNGSNTNSGLLRTAAFQTIATANSTAKFGDTVIILAASGTISGAQTLSTSGVTWVMEIGASCTHSSGATITVTGRDVTLYAITSNTTDVDLGWPVNCQNTINCHLIGCRLGTTGAPYDGLYAQSSTGLYIGGGTSITGAYDGVMLVGVVGALIENCKITTTANYAGNQSASGLHYSTAIMDSSQVTFKNCELIADKPSGTTTDTNTSGLRIQNSSAGSAGSVYLEGCEIRVLAEDAAQTGAVYGIVGLQSAQAEVTMIGGGIHLSNSSASTTKDVSIANSASSKARLYGTACDPTRFAGDVKLNDYDVTAVKTKTDYLPSVTAGQANGLFIAGSNAATTVASLTSSGAFTINGTSTVAQTGDSFARLGSPAGASISADIATRLATSGYTTPPTAAANAAAVLAATNGGATVGTQLQHLDSDVSDAGGGGTVSPFILDDSHTWSFDSRDQITSPDILTESVGEATIFKAVDFDLALTKDGSIASVGSVTVADVSGATEPTITSAEFTANKRKVNLTINASAATAATYTITVPITTTDGRTFKRKVKLTLQ